jgi:hypothetical protein
MQVSTLRPGLLVSLKTSITGNVVYNKRDIEPDHETDNMRRAVWETERVISDADEHEEAVKVRGRVRSLVTSLCAASGFGLLCPESRKADLDEAIIAARKLADSFNDKSRITRVTVNVIAGRIAADDVEAIRAINSEIRDLLATMEQGVARLDAAAVREAANKARALGMMLSPSAQSQVQAAIEIARNAARKIVKSGETAANEVDEATLRALRASRSAFLDIDGDDTVAAPAIAANAVDFEPAETVPVARPVASQKVEMEI